MLREECRLPFRVIQRYLKWRFGLGLSVGNWWLWSVGRRSMAKRNTPGYAKRFGPARWCTGDETGWRQDGRNGYLWSFSTPEVRYFLHRPGRSQRVVVEVLGDEFEGVLVSDFYGAYNVYQGRTRDAGPTCCVTSTN